jgi:hypothetical protein
MKRGRMAHKAASHSSSFLVLSMHSEVYGGVSLSDASGSAWRAEAGTPELASSMLQQLPVVAVQSISARRSCLQCFWHRRLCWDVIPLLGSQGCVLTKTPFCSSCAFTDQVRFGGPTSQAWFLVQRTVMCSLADFK